MSERTPLQTYEINSLVVNIGRDQDMDLVVDSTSISRQQAQIRLEPDGRWAVEDLGSANGTFLNGRRVVTRQPLTRGDEITFGTFSLFFDRTFDDVKRGSPTRLAGPRVPTQTVHLAQEEMARLQHEVALKRRAHLRWEAGGLRGTYYLEADRPAVLIGRSSLCDLPVPAGPRYHVLVSRRSRQVEVRNLSGWHRMRVNGRVTDHAALRDGDLVEIGRRLRLTFVDALGS